MKITCLIFLTVMSVLVVTECKPLSDDVENGPSVDSEQKQVRSKRCLPCLFRLPPLLVPPTRLPIVLPAIPVLPPNNYNGQFTSNHVVPNSSIKIGNGNHNINTVNFR